MKWIHIIGVAGVSTSGIATMFKQLGWKVTGSDKGFFPPISTYLSTHGIDVMPGFKPERLTAEDGSHPDLVVIQGTKGDQNAEYLEASKLGITIKTYPELIAEYVVKEGASIVVAGTYGKTTITAALAWMFTQAGFPISHMIGGISSNLETSTIPRDTATRFSIVEGDEYITSLSDNRSKFFHYKPTHLILNSISWEHPDVFKTEAAYIANFQTLVEQIPEHGLLVTNANDEHVVKVCKAAKCKVVYYSQNQAQAAIAPDWYLTRLSKPLPSFIREPKDELPSEIIPYSKQIIGDFNEENLLAATVLAYELGVKKERIQNAIEGFTGIKRRLEIKLQKNNITVIDDFGSSPPKAAGALSALRQDFLNSYIIAVFEPNSGNRVETALPLYKKAFTDADVVYLPKFTALPRTDQKRFGAQELLLKLKEYKINVHYFDDDDELVTNIITSARANSTKQSIICFLGSHSFRGMITKTVNRLSGE